MIFKEKILNISTSPEFQYEVEDVFGKITILSPTKLEGSGLDALVMQVLANKAGSQIINKIYKITYEPRNHWEEDNEEENPTA